MATRGVFEKQKDSGIWWIRYTDQFGKLHREKVGPKSLATAAYQKRKTEIREGKFFPEKALRRRKKVLFKDMARIYLDDHSRVNKKSWKTDKCRLRILEERFGEMALSEVTKQDVERFRGQLAQSRSEATGNRYMALLKNLFNKAIDWGKAEQNPVTGIKQFKETWRVRYLTDEEEEVLREVFPPNYWPWVEVAFHTGMRRSEQLNLLWENVSFKTRTITIPMSKHGEMRHIPINDRVLEIFQDSPSRMKSEWVFPSGSLVTPMDGKNFVSRVFMPAVKEAGITDFRWHDLRHTFASRLVMAGADLKSVQELMGHKTIAMTMKYAHLSPGHRMNAVQLLCSTPSSARTEKRTDTTTDTSQKERATESP